MGHHSLSWKPQWHMPTVVEVSRDRVGEVCWRIFPESFDHHVCINRCYYVWVQLVIPFSPWNWSWILKYCFWMLLGIFHLERLRWVRLMGLLVIAGMFRLLECQSIILTLKVQCSRIYLNYPLNFALQSRVSEWSPALWKSA